MPLKIIDGNGNSDQATVKAGSTAAVAADKPLVVTIHPSSATLNVTASDGSGPLTIDGTVTANIGSTNGLALDATLTGGTAKAVVRGGAKGATAAADVTSTSEGTDHNAIDVQLYHGGSAINPQTIRALTNTDVVSGEITKWIGATTPTVGQKTMAASLPVALASDQPALSTQDASTLADNAPFTDGTSKVIPAGFIFDESAGAALTENDVGAARVTVNRAQVITIEDSTTRGQRLGITAAGSAKVEIVTTSTTPTVATVAANASSVQLYASNASAKQRTTRNDSTTATLYLGEGTAATTTMPIAISPGQIYEHATPLFTGVVNGIWSAAVGNARTREAT